ncbi:uncharacterized protein LOC114255840 [Camellia sinensis]|uniref:uncharacterized protein LOC114255840 n=1 Tax=Camellia sinensis TaxID=4442 RepID=UPI001035CED0|nr:uncharacterized protein LOC114255840 [Camellia sinensis]
MAAIKSTYNVRKAETVEIEDEDMELLDDINKEPADKSEEALKNILIKEDDVESFFLLGSGLVEEEERELEALSQANIELVDTTSGHGRMSFLDAYREYHQIVMYPPDEEKTAFITPKGLYCYKVIPFGLKNTGATY